MGRYTTLVEGYVVEGHVPIGALLRMLTERPAIKGISLPGMPAGSPGMFEKAGPFTIYDRRWPDSLRGRVTMAPVCPA